MNDEPYNAAERSHVKAAAKASRFADKSRVEVISRIMDSPAGRAYILDLLTRCHVFASSFSSNSLSMAFAEGERNIGLQVLNDLMQHAPQSYTLMMEEENARRFGTANIRQPPREPESVGDPESSEQD